MPQSLQESINQVLETLPPSNAPMVFEDWRTTVLASGIENAQGALAIIVKNRLANQELKPLNTDARTLILTEAQGKKPDGSPVPYRFVLAVSKLPV